MSGERRIGMFIAATAAAGIGLVVAIEEWVGPFGNPIDGVFGIGVGVVVVLSWGAAFARWL